MKKHLKDELIIIRRIAINENDLLISAFTKSMGKITIKALGSKKILSRFVGKLEPLSVNMAEIYFSGRSYTLTNITSQIAPPLAPNLKNFATGQEICKILYKTLPEEQPNLSMYNYIKEIIIHLPKISQEDELLFFFYTKYLKDTGNLPDIRKCFKCDKKHVAAALMDNEGQITCVKCSNANAVNELSFNTLKTLNYFTFSPSLEHALKLKIPSSTKQELANCLKSFMNQFS